MKPAKLDILFAFTNYAGNGGIASTIPHLRSWWAKQFELLSKDERIGRIADLPQGMVSDTPITMVRNKCLRVAQEQGFDLLVFVDSDNCPDLYVDTDTNAKPFLTSSLDFVYRRLVNGIPTIIAAPYCGPPPHPVSGGEENVYVFKWESLASGDEHFTGARVEPYGRDEAALMKGIHPAAALPTGLCMICLKTLECLPPPYFRYEWEDEWEDKKASTEDVYFTRNIGMAGARRYNTPIVFCNWDSWAGHYKQKMVGRPVVMRVQDVCEVYAKAILDGHDRGDEMHYLGFKRDGTVDTPESLQLAVASEDDIKEFEEATGIDPRPSKIKVNGHDHWYIGWLTNGEDTSALLRALGETIGDQDHTTGVEVGSWCGYTATLMLDEFPQIDRLMCVDTFEGAPTDITMPLKRVAGIHAGDGDVIYSMFQRNTARFGQRVQGVKSTSLTAAFSVRELQDTKMIAPLDFVFIDADHAYDAVIQDIRAWLPLIRPGGVIIGHDYSEDFPGVKQAVHEVFGQNVDTSHNVWWAQVTEDMQVFPEDEDHTIIAAMEGDKYTERDDTLIDPADRESLKQMLSEVLGRFGHDGRKMVYIGQPDPATLDALAVKGRVFCVCEPSGSVRHAITLTGVGVKFLQVEYLEESIYQDAWWDDADADLVFVHKDAASTDLLQRSLSLLKRDGLLCGNGNVNAAAFEGSPIGPYRETGIWGILRSDYEDAMEANGKAVVH